MRKCNTDSGPPWQMGHKAESAAPMQCRCLLSRTWPVRSWNNKLACRRGSPSMSFINELEGTELSIRWIELRRGDLAKRLIFLFFRSALNRCLEADLLMGKVIRLWKQAGRVASWLEPSVAAFFTNSSTTSLPCTPSWPGIHLTTIKTCGLVFLMHLISFKNKSIK